VVNNTVSCLESFELSVTEEGKKNLDWINSLEIVKISRKYRILMKIKTLTMEIQIKKEKSEVNLYDADMKNT